MPLGGAQVCTAFGYDTDAVVASTGSVSHGVVKRSLLNGLNCFQTSSLVGQFKEIPLLENLLISYRV